jgi:hypothetical protein
MDYARLDREKIAKLRALEEELGNWVIALQPAVTLADLTADQIKKLKEVEDEIGVILIAYKPPTD